MVWKQLGLSQWLYEIVPGFFVNAAVLTSINLVAPQTNADVKVEFEKAIQKMRWESGK